MSIALCMIVKSEKDLSRNTLLRLARHFDEISIVFNQRGKARTENIAAVPCRIRFMPDERSLAKLRNFCKSGLSSKWLFYLDADEEVSRSSILKIRDAARSAGPKIGAFFCWVANHGNDGSMWMFPVLRALRNIPALKFQFDTHETISFSLRKKGLNAKRIDGAVIEHLGYLGDQDWLRARNKKYIASLQAELKSYTSPDCDDAMIVYMLIAYSHLLRNEVEAARMLLERAVKLRPDNSHASRLLCQVYYFLGDLAKALFHLERYKIHTSDEPDTFHNWAGKIALAQKKKRLALAQFQKAVHMAPYKPHYKVNLSNIFFICAEKKKAVYWKRLAFQQTEMLSTGHFLPGARSFLLKDAHPLNELV